MEEVSEATLAAGKLRTLAEAYRDSEAKALQDMRKNALPWTSAME